MGVDAVVAKDRNYRFSIDVLAFVKHISDNPDPPNFQIGSKRSIPENIPD